MYTLSRNAWKHYSYLKSNQLTQTKMEPINHVALQWTAEDIERRIENLSSDDQVIAESRIDSYEEFLENVIEENKYEIMEFINFLINKAIYNEIK